MCDRVRRGKDSRYGTCWYVTGSEDGRIVGKEACWCVTGSEEGRIVGRWACWCVTGSEEGRLVGRGPVGM